MRHYETSEALLRCVGMSDSTRWLSTKEASQHLGVNLRTLYRFIDEGELPAYKFGRVIRLREPDLEHFVESARIAPGSLEHLYPEPARPAGR
ncbi:MAG: DNA-binding protein [Acidimicrobiaceae bacterium]|jgi:excisionase family DNA binding protein|nr:DNA-binding protein [Acidimicrobiaceae bacterium]